jgi:hypothetical protein
MEEGGGGGKGSEKEAFYLTTLSVCGMIDGGWMNE